MKLFQDPSFQFQKNLHALAPAEALEIFPENNGLHAPTGKSTKPYLKKIAFKQRIFRFYCTIKFIGASAQMDDYEKRKLGIFNQLNFFQIITGLLIPLMGLFNNPYFPAWAWPVASLPSLISIIVLWLNGRKKQDAAILVYFICYPVASSIVYLSGINMGMELFFIFFGVLSVFFIPQLYLMLFSVSLSMISYFMLSVLWMEHRYELETSNYSLYLFNEFLGILFIFYGLFLIKKENSTYHTRVLSKNREIAETATQLKNQTRELTELNTVKDKLFSVIAHDLKTPMYALRNLFRNIQQQKLPAKEIKSMMPEVVNDLNYTTGLMENLLQWAKSQMQSETVKIQLLDLPLLGKEVIQLLQLQADAKQIKIETCFDMDARAMADKDMINLVMRNLLSNAIKFTPAKGRIEMGVNDLPHGVEVYVKDNGRGINAEAINSIHQNNYFSTNGTDHEPGTGLGLMLCKEFLLKNASQLFIESEAGMGSTFSFTLARPE